MSDGADACPFCASRDWMTLPDPAPSRAILSDLRVLPIALMKRACAGCGYACRPPLAADAAGVFGADYELGATPPSPIDRARQERYAAWIAAALAGTATDGARGSSGISGINGISGVPASVLDAGCGNGGLLLALRERWPAARLSGVEPSPNAARRAREAGLDVAIVTVEGMEGTRPPFDAVDLAISVNVLEHTVDPVRFLQGLASALRPGGTLIVICPDGASPGLELLFVDHLHSFTSAHLAALCRQAGLHPRAGHARGPAAAGFQMMIADRERPDERAESVEPVLALASPALARAKARYLDRWRTLDARLTARLDDDRGVICFGVGEAAGLLRAYAPEAWARVGQWTVDVDVSDPPREYAGLPVVPLDRMRESERTLLLAVNPMDQAAVAARLARDTRLRVVTWADLVDDG